ncbi:MAG: formimidoylglutamase [Kurthia sp.]|nr:formimidoylglutamase [Candidatus Kurthia equi]
MEKSMEQIWTGRIDANTTADNARYHQIIEHQSLGAVTEQSVPTVGIIGFECDEGVRRNGGQVGSAKAPNEIRHALANIPWRAPQPSKVIDFGNVVCRDGRLEQAQEELGEAVHTLIQANNRVVVLGGGHETLYGHYLGVRKAYGKNKRIGLLNIDAHFDLRDYSEQTSSGTMFKQILDEDSQAQYMVCGIGRYSNTTELFKRAEAYNVQFFYEDDLSRAELQLAIDEFAQKCDIILLTVCMDVIDVAHAPGVSATAAFGLLPKQVREIIQIVMQHPTATTFNICEVNPDLDHDHRTEKLAAQLTNEAILGLL